MMWKIKKASEKPVEEALEELAEKIQELMDSRRREELEVRA